MALTERRRLNNDPTFGYSQAPFDYYDGLAGPQLNLDAARMATGSAISHIGFSPTGSGSIQMDRSRNISQSSAGIDWNDASMSESSPTSMGTPDNESFERTLDESMLNHYHQSGSMEGRVLSNADTMDVADVPIHAPASFEFTSQDTQNPFNATLPHMFNVNNISSLSTGPNVNPPGFDQAYASSFTQQPAQQDPWNSHYPLRSPDEPGSDVLVFDPGHGHVHNHVDFETYNDFPIDAANQALLSPWTLPELGGPFLFEGRADVQMALSNPPFDNLILGQPTVTIPNNQPPRSPTSASPGANSMVAHTGHSPYRESASPFTNAQSPGSDVIMSSRASDAGANIDPVQVETFNAVPSPSPVMKIDPVQEPVMYGPTEPAEQLETPHRPRQRGQRAHLHGRPGGRQLGSHLKPDVAKDAHDMRKVVACWHCVLQRDKCGPGDICERCVKRAQRPNTDMGLGCSRVKLVELSFYFLPSVMTSIHEDAALTNFVQRHIRQWSNMEVSLKLTCGSGLPPLNCKVYEFIPSTNELLRQFQYRTDPQTQQRIRVEKSSPPLGMIQLNHTDEKKYDKYVNEIVDSYLDPFGDLFWMEDNNDFQVKLFKLMIQLRPQSEDERKLLREIMRLMVVTFIMGHTITMVEESKVATLSRLHSYRGPGDYVENFCSPRMTNRQLKYFFCRLHRNIMQNVLNKLQQIFKSSKGCDKWTSAFCAVIGLAMAHEDNQKTIHLVMETKAAAKETTHENAQLESDYACREIDSKFGFIAAIFRWKYNRSCNPLRDSEHDWSSKLKERSALTFVKNVANLVRENTEFLNERRRVGISGANSTKYASRLVADFLLSFWLPS